MAQVDLTNRKIAIDQCTAWSGV